MIIATDVLNIRLLDRGGADDYVAGVVISEREGVGANRISLLRGRVGDSIHYGTATVVDTHAQSKARRGYIRLNRCLRKDQSSHHRKQKTLHGNLDPADVGGTRNPTANAIHGTADNHDERMLIRHPQARPAAYVD